MAPSESCIWRPVIPPFCFAPTLAGKTLVLPPTHSARAPCYKYPLPWAQCYATGKLSPPQKAVKYKHSILLRCWAVGPSSANTYLVSDMMRDTRHHCLNQHSDSSCEIWRGSRAEHVRISVVFFSIEGLSGGLFHRVCVCAVHPCVLALKLG